MSLPVALASGIYIVAKINISDITQTDIKRQLITILLVAVMAAAPFKVKQVHFSPYSTIILPTGLALQAV
jgi:hypothetical protein